MGLVNDELSVIQHHTKLYAIRHTLVTESLMYQHILRQFGSFSRMALQEPLPLSELVMCALENPHNGYLQEDGPQDVLAREIETLLIEKASMLAEYFGIDIDSEVGPKY